MNQWLSFYYPTTAIFVDDEKIFLDILNSRVSHDIPRKMFSNPIKALKFIEARKPLLCDSIDHPFFLDEQLNELEPDLLGLGFRWDSFINTSYNIERFSILSVVIVDYMMPELNGIDFCKKIKNNPIKKIMLTANSDTSMAVKAFNDGIIDCFLVKDSPNLLMDLIEKIKLLQNNYFNDQINRTFGLFFEKIYHGRESCMLNFYEKIREQLGAVEYYLLDRFGSVLFLDHHGSPTTLVVCSTKGMEMFSQIAEDQDELKIAKNLADFKKILFFPNKIDCMLPASKWNNFLHSANAIPGCDDLFYAIVTNPLCQPVDIKKIQSKLSHEKIATDVFD